MSRLNSIAFVYPAGDPRPTCPVGQHTERGGAGGATVGVYRRYDRDCGAGIVYATPE
jgi:hypothetical protein